MAESFQNIVNTPLNSGSGDSLYAGSEKLNTNFGTLADKFKWGNGSPEGYVTAAPGAIYQDMINGFLYVKRTGSGNIGWISSTVVLKEDLPTDTVYDADMEAYVKAFPKIPFSLYSGNKDAGGNADILAFSGTTLSFKIGGAYPSLVLTYADKTQEIVASIADIADIRQRFSSILPTMTSNTLPAGYTATGSTEFSASYKAFQAFDKNNSTLWAGGTGVLPSIVKIEIPVTKVAKAVRFRTSGYAPSAFTIWGSNNNGTTTVTLYTGGVLAVNTTYDLELSNNTAYTQYGITITSNAVGSEAQVAELDFLELDDVGSIYFNGAYTAIKKKGVATAYALLSSRVTQGKAFPTSPIAGDLHCDISTELLATYEYSGSAWVETQYDIIGYATVAGNVITDVSTRAYGQNGYEVNSNSFIQSLATNGYIKLPNGLILQWGNCALPSNSYTSVTFPIAFPNAVLKVIPSFESNGAYSDTYATYMGAGNESTSGFRVYAGTARAAYSVNWFAIGY